VLHDIHCARLSKPKSLWDAEIKNQGIQKVFFKTILHFNIGSMFASLVGEGFDRPNADQQLPLDVNYAKVGEWLVSHNTQVIMEHLSYCIVFHCLLFLS